jgi:hypothetical protein
VKRRDFRRVLWLIEKPDNHGGSGWPAVGLRLGRPHRPPIGTAPPKHGARESIMSNGGQPDRITIARDLDFYRMNPPSHRQS